jgi:hypothetical protein
LTLFSTVLFFCFLSAIAYIYLDLSKMEPMKTFFIDHLNSRILHLPAILCPFSLNQLVFFLSFYNINRYSGKVAENS